MNVPCICLRINRHQDFKVPPARLIFFFVGYLQGIQSPVTISFVQTLRLDLPSKVAVPDLYPNPRLRPPQVPTALLGTVE